MSKVTRDAVLKRLTRKLRHWEGSRLEYRTANELLKIVEECEPTLRNSWAYKPKQISKTTKRKRDL